MAKMNVDRIREEYAFVSSKFTPKYVDKLTFVLINYAQQKVLDRFISEVVFEMKKSFKRELSGEIFRLLIDCYILGRIEIGNQRSTRYYTKNSNDSPSFYRNNEKIVDEMSLWVRSILKEDRFIKIPPEIHTMILMFNKNAGDNLVNFVEYNKKNVAKLAKLLFWASLVGREIALVERLAYDLKYRNTIEPNVKKIINKEHKKWLQGLLKSAK